jgi:hypothetical protein
MGVLLTRRQRLSTGVLAVLAFATATIWLADQAEAQRRGQQAADALACPRGAVPSGRTFSEATPNIQLAQQSIVRDAANAQALTLAASACRGELTDRSRRNNLLAYACVAEAQTKLAALEPTEANYRAAYCAHAAVAGLAGSQNASLAADAQQARGDILMRLRAISNPSSELGSNYLTQAIRDYREAVRAPNAARHFALGGALMARGNVAEANEQIRLGAAAQPANAQEAQAAVRAIVQLAGAEPAPSDANALLERAIVLDPTSTSANTALGMRLAQSDPVRAARLFNVAINGRNDSADHPGRNYLAEANYHVAQREMLNGNWTAALSSGQAALRAGGATDIKYGRLVCLAYIARGWTRQTEDSTACAIDTSTPQGELVTMMHHLRRAQYLNVRDAAGRDRILLQTPERQQHQMEMIAVIQAYERANAGIANWTEAQRQAALQDWPAAGSIPAADRDIRQMLEFGRWVLAHECPGGARLPAYSSDGPGTVRGRGREFFRRYNVSSCRAS